MRRSVSAVDLSPRGAGSHCPCHRVPDSAERSFRGGITAERSSIHPMPGVSFTSCINQGGTHA